MKTSIVVVAVLAAAAARGHEGGGHAVPQAKPAVEVGVAKALELYRAAFEARSTDKLAEAVDPKLLVLEGTTKNEGWADYRDNHIGPEMKGWDSLAYSDVKLVDYEAAGDVAWAATTAAVTIVEGGKPLVLDVAESFVLRRSGGVWRIRHLHWSGRRRPEAKPAAKP